MYGEGCGLDGSEFNVLLAHVSCREAGGGTEFCICVCMDAFAFSWMCLSRLHERDMDVFVSRLVHLGLQMPVKLFY